MAKAGEKRKEERSEQLLGPLDNRQIKNEALEPLLEEIDSIEAAKTDPFLLYLHGILYARNGQQTMGFDLLIQSVNIYPYNYSAWQELAACINTNDTLIKALKRIPHSVMLKFMLAGLNQEFLSSSSEVRVALDDLHEFFPNHPTVKSLRAIQLYHLREFEEAEETFENILLEDPHHIDDMDLYSNILYVTENSSKLSFLAQFAHETDQYRSETCTIIGKQL